jgi:hypothetical protein
VSVLDVGSMGEDDGAGWMSGAHISTREAGGEGMAPDDEDDERCRDSTQRHRLYIEEGRGTKSGQIRMHG